MNKHRKGLYIISGLFYLFFSGALALYPTKMTVGATISMIAGAVLQIRCCCLLHSLIYL